LQHDIEQYSNEQRFELFRNRIRYPSATSNALFVKRSRPCLSYVYIRSRLSNEDIYIVSYSLTMNREWTESWQWGINSPIGGYLTYPQSEACPSSQRGYRAV